jgi:predicted negative regulator of RcsB-dependent stress response
VGTTKLTRKEILAEDPVHVVLIRIVELFRTKGKFIALGAGSVLLVALGIYFGMKYLDSRDANVQLQFAKAMDFFHARIDANALDDPYGKGPEPLFRTETLKYQAAAKAFADLQSRLGGSKLGIGAQYYLGLCRLNLGEKDAAVRALEAVRNNSKERTFGYLAKKTLATYHLDNGNPKASQEILEGMIKDPQCQLPREDLKLDLAQVLAAQNKREEALKVLREARGDSTRSMFLSRINQEIDRLEGRSPVRPEDVNAINVGPR